MTIYTTPGYSSDAPTLGTFDGIQLLNIPSEIMYFDLLIPVGLTDPTTVNTRVYYDPLELSQQKPKDIVPIREIPNYRGKVRPNTMPLIPEAPKYTKMIHHVSGLLGWSETEFDLYRYRIEYPILHSATVLAVNRIRQKS